jgi:hypothetical protein
MANSNPNFDYSAFMNLETHIKAGDIPEVLYLYFQSTRSLRFRR